MRLSSQDTHTVMLNTHHCAARADICDLNTSYGGSMSDITDVCMNDSCVHMCAHLDLTSVTLYTCTECSYEQC